MARLADKALAALWPEVPVQRCTVHKQRNLLAHAPKRLHDEIGADYTDMIYAETCRLCSPSTPRFLRKWRVRCLPSPTAGGGRDRLFSFLRFPPSNGARSAPPTRSKRLLEEFKRRIKTQCCCPAPRTACLLFWRSSRQRPESSSRQNRRWHSLHLPLASYA